ncbi:MAG: Tetraspanin family-domain-containing protein [Piptocephalis tieghemiana]|nr:MAG: Tetraspanin family-domain-containing protein [Piptocephalis tieghemiana]
MNSPNGKDLLEWSTLLFSVLLGIAGTALAITSTILLLTSQAPLWSHFVLWVLLALAIGTFLTSVLGCGAAVSGNLSLRTMYAFALLILIIPQLLLSTMAVTRTTSIERLLETNWQYTYDHHPDYLIYIEEHYNCCGFRDITDHPVHTPNSSVCPALPSLSSTLPCLQALSSSWRHDHSPLLGIFGFAIVILQLLALATTMTLRRRDISDQERAEEERNLLVGEENSLLNSSSDRSLPSTFNHPSSLPSDGMAHGHQAGYQVASQDVQAN